MLDFIKAILASVEIIMIFIIYIINVVCYIYNLPYVEPNLHSQYKPNLVIMYNLASIYLPCNGRWCHIQPKGGKFVKQLQNKIFRLFTEAKKRPELKCKLEWHKYRGTSIPKVKVLELEETLKAI